MSPKTTILKVNRRYIVNYSKDKTTKSLSRKTEGMEDKHVDGGLYIYTKMFVDAYICMSYRGIKERTIRYEIDDLNTKKGFKFQIKEEKNYFAREEFTHNLSKKYHVLLAGRLP